MTSIKDLCEKFNYEPSKMTTEQKQTIKLLTYWAEAKVESKIKPLTNKVKYLEKENDKLKKELVEIQKKMGKSIKPGDEGFKYDKKGSILITKYKDVIVITGSTYDVKTIIKSYENPKWEGTVKGWIIDRENDVDDLVKELDPYIKKIQVADSNNNFSDL